jgi:hypothetical protein
MDELRTRSAPSRLELAVQGASGVAAASGAVTTLGEVFDTTYPAGQAGLSTKTVTASFDDFRVSAG